MRRNTKKDEKKSGELMKKGRRLLAMLLVFVMLSGVIGPDTLMKLAAYADDGIVETTERKRQRKR